MTTYTDPPVVITGIMPGLPIRMTLVPPVADWLCRCSHHERAVSRAAVVELTTRVRVDHCPHPADEAAVAKTVDGEVAARKGVPPSALCPDPHPTARSAPGRRDAA
ncbi:hypothetical protein [Streptomyces sp. NPDC002889]|uniref:hypothetical protein n=1 Tax=Streptomyces sp. NPDC002889 TaxID=3364669 RepID=UPI0036A139A0